MNKKLFLTVFFIFSIILSVNAQTLLIENFDYPAGDSLGAHGWVSFSGGATNVLTVTSPGLTYLNYSGSGIGNAATVKTTGQDAYKPLSSPDSVGNLYVSFMASFDSAKTAGDYFFALLPSTSTTLYTARVYARDSLGLRFGLSKSSATSGPIVYGNTTFNYGTTYLFVVKYSFLTGSTTDDEMSLFVFTSPSLPTTEPSTPYVGPVTGTIADVANIGRIALRQGTAANAPYLVIDGFKVTKSWTSIVTSVKNFETTDIKFELSQNFPNPFNPTTNINFSIPAKGLAIIKLYDINGKEVKSLLNSELNQGNYTMNLNLSGFNTGVYFYTLKFISSEYNLTETKKLLLVK